MFNKKGDFGLSILFLILIIAGITYYQEQIQNKTYIGDASTNVAYNLKSESPNCNINSIRISPSNHRLFANEAEAISQGFRIDLNCV